MNHPLRTAVVSGIIAASALFAPTAAWASDIYPPSGSCTVSSTTVVPGAAVGFRCLPDTFSGDEAVTITVTGENGAAAKIGMIRLAVTTTSGSATSEADGSLADVSIRLPSDATGIYNMAAISATSAGGTAAVTASNVSGGLSSTGLQGASLLGASIGGGVLLLVGGALAVVAVLRRAKP